MAEGSDDDGKGRWRRWPKGAKRRRCEGWFHDPDPGRNKVRHPDIEKSWREGGNFAFAQIADMNSLAHEITLLASADFGTTAQSTESITPPAPPLFPLMSRCARWPLRKIETLATNVSSP